LGCAFVVTAFAGEESALTVSPDLSLAGVQEQWDLDGSGTWELADGKLVLSGAGTPGGPIRRPAALAILKSEPLGKVAVDAEVRSTAPVDLPVRDVLFIVAYQSPSRFYYIHLSARTDEVHNGIFLVNDADRRRIDDGKGVPKMIDQEWHKARMERDPATGRIEVYVDGAPEPVLKATDTTLQSGRIGFGSFDETGEFRAITVTGAR
jgi:hypothetical protein